MNMEYCLQEVREALGHVERPLCFDSDNDADTVNFFLMKMELAEASIQDNKSISAVPVTAFTVHGAFRSNSVEGAPELNLTP